MNQKQVKINGLKINHQFGILQVCELEFDEKIGMYVTKGKSGHGKTHVTTALKLATLGGKALVDNQKYGTVDLEVQLTDGDYKLWVSCKSVKKSLQFKLFAKDENGKKIKKLIIDGVEAKPTEYLKALQTELTWRMDELTSENPAVQKKILLQLYQSQLKTIGVIFDKKHPQYGASILGLIDAAVLNRDQKDYHRKTLGGIADDLKAQGHDPDRPDTCPDSVNIEEIETKIKEIEKEKILATAEPEAQKAKDLAEIKAQAMEVTNRCLAYNSGLQKEYNDQVAIYKERNEKIECYDDALSQLAESMQYLGVYVKYWDTIIGDVDVPKLIDKPKEPNYIQFKDGQVTISPDMNRVGNDLMGELSALRVVYSNRAQEDSTTDVSHFDSQLEALEKTKIQANGINKIVSAIDSFHQWRAANEDVVKLKDEYVKLLAQIDTGVEGLEIRPIEDDIFLMYDGSYDVSYFNPRGKVREMHKVSSYSGTQQPVICLLIQNYLLSKKPKAMRYLHIDNIPIDNTSKALLDKMSKELDLHIFLNITGDFENDKLEPGEILIEGGEIFFKN